MRLCLEARCQNCDQMMWADPSRAELLQRNAVSDSLSRRLACTGLETRHVPQTQARGREACCVQVTSVCVMTVTCSWGHSLHSRTVASPDAWRAASLGCGWRIRVPHPLTPRHHEDPYHRHSHITCLHNLWNLELFLRISPLISSSAHFCPESFHRRWLISFDPRNCAFGSADSSKPRICKMCAFTNP